MAAKANISIFNDLRSRGNKTKRGAVDVNRTRVLSLGSRASTGVPINRESHSGQTPCSAINQH
jgi:hypothetical protein